MYVWYTYRSHLVVLLLIPVVLIYLKYVVMLIMIPTFSLLLLKFWIVVKLLIVLAKFFGKFLDSHNSSEYFNGVDTMGFVVKR